MNRIEDFTTQLTDVKTLTPRKIGSGKSKKKIAQAIYTRQVVTIVGIKTATSRFLPVSHEGYSNETYVDKLDLLGTTHAEFIGRKLKGIERRAHMNLFREMAASCKQPVEQGKPSENDEKTSWETFFKKYFDAACLLPDKLCLGLLELFSVWWLNSGQRCNFFAHSIL